MISIPLCSSVVNNNHNKGSFRFTQRNSNDFIKKLGILMKAKQNEENS